MGHLGGDPALVADARRPGGRRASRSRPPLAELVVEPFRLGILLDVDLDDPLAELADPFLGIAELDDVADVEVGDDRGALELVDVAGELEGAEQELVPDLLDGDLDAVPLGVGDELADLGLRPR